MGPKTVPKRFQNRCKIDEKWTSKSMKILYAFGVAFDGSWRPTWAQKPPKMEPKKDPNRGLKAVRAENCKTLIFYDS